MTFFNSPNFKENLDLKTYNRAYFFQVSESVINECESGFYVNKSGETVELKEKESITLTDFVDHENKISLKKEKSKKKGELDVKFLTTIGAGYELVVEEGYEKTIALNFANPIEPGGGFLRGSNAQEECCCRCSGLYKTILSRTEFYENNIKNQQNGLSTDGMIISKKVPVYRDDTYNYLDKPFYLDFITSPAPIAYQYKSCVKNGEKTLKKVIKERIRKILVECINREYDCIILCAYGCGAFGNDPEYVSSVFYEYLIKKGYKNYFEKVVFAIFSPRNTELFDLFSKKFYTVEEEIRKIQKNFHKLIFQRANSFGINEINVELPDLLKKESGYFAVPGMYGGFSYSLSAESDCKHVLYTESWCRVCGGSGQIHEVTADEIKLIDTCTDYK